MLLTNTCYKLITMNSKSKWKFNLPNCSRDNINLDLLSATFRLYLDRKALDDLCLQGQSFRELQLCDKVFNQECTTRIRVMD